MASVHLLRQEFVMTHVERLMKNGHNMNDVSLVRRSKKTSRGNIAKMHIVA